MSSMAASLSGPAGGGIPDDEVVRRVVAGERELFELLLRRYNQRIYRSVCGVVRDPADAEDVMQQVWVSAFRHLHQFEGRSSVATWLTTIALREARAGHRKRGRILQAVPGPGAEDAMNEIPEPGPDPESRAVTAEMLHHLETEISALPEAYRSVLLLREVEGLSTVETAACLEVSEDVVKTRLHRARGMVRDALYRRAGSALPGTFTFGSARCDRVVAAVMDEIRSL